MVCCDCADDYDFTFFLCVCVRVCLFLLDFLPAGLVVSQQQPADSVLVEAAWTPLVHGGLAQVGGQLPHQASFLVGGPHDLNAAQV